MNILLLLGVIGVVIGWVTVVGIGWVVVCRLVGLVVWVK